MPSDPVLPAEYVGHSDGRDVVYRVIPGCTAKIGSLRCGRRKGHAGPHETPFNGNTAVWRNSEWSTRNDGHVCRPDYQNGVCLDCGEPARYDGVDLAD